MLAVELKTDPIFGGFCVKTGPRVVLKPGPSLFTVFPIFKCFGGMFKNTNSVSLCQNSVFTKLSGCQNEISKRKIHFWFFFLIFFYVVARETEKRKKQNGKMPKTL